MKPFEYRQVRDAGEAVAAVHASPGASYLGAGTNLVDHMKLGLVSPEVLVDVTQLPYRYVESLPDGGLRVGSAVRNSEMAADPRIRERYPMLSQALLAGASGQLRNLATTGGNLLQRTRCVFFRDVSTPCNKREPGTGCPARGSDHARDFAVLGASDSCVATHPSDMAVALVALDAVVRIQGPQGARTVPVTELYRLPGTEPHRDTVLDRADLITAVDLPKLPMARRSAYRKVRDRASFAFALVSVAVALEVEGNTVREARIAFGGLAHKPWRALRAEAALRGKPASEKSFRDAAEAELAEAKPLPGNEFKVLMAKNTLVSVLRSLV